MGVRTRGSAFLAVAGWIAIGLFAAIYALELLPHRGPPVTVRWIREHVGTGGLIALNVAIVLAFLALLPFRRPTRKVWKSHGTFAAFVIALMTEMFGWPLFIFLVSPFFEVPTIARDFYGAVGHWPSTIGTAMSLSGITLIAIGWKQVHAAEGLVSGGLYRYMRHPQYTGMFLFTLGWILHWPTVLTLLLWPVLVAAYVRLSRFEEKQALEEFGESYRAYAGETRRFIPFLV